MPLRPARSRQLSLFGVEARPPNPLDLEGLLAGAGQVSRMGGTARVSIVVGDAWRALGDSAQAADASVKIVSPTRNIRFRPNRSPSLPPSRINTADVST